MERLSRRFLMYEFCATPMAVYENSAYAFTHVVRGREIKSSRYVRSKEKNTCYVMCVYRMSFGVVAHVARVQQYHHSGSNTGICTIRIYISEYFSTETLEHTFSKSHIFRE